MHLPLEWVQRSYTVDGQLQLWLLKPTGVSEQQHSLFQTEIIIFSHGLYGVVYEVI